MQTAAASLLALGLVGAAWGIGIIIGVLLIVDLAKRIYDVFSKPPCGLHKYILMPNKCSGTCTAPSVCVSTGRGSYFFGLIGQDTGCKCGAVGSGVPGGAGSSATSGASQIKDAKDGLKPAEKHTEDAKKAIDDASK